MAHEQEKKEWRTKLTSGPARFYVDEAKEEVSKAGNPMIVLKLIIEQDLSNGPVREWCRDYLLPAYPKKMNALCKAANRPEMQTIDCTPRNLIGLQGPCELEYDPEWKNCKIKKYVFPKEKKGPRPIPQAHTPATIPDVPSRQGNTPHHENDFDDDVPF